MRIDPITAEQANEQSVGDPWPAGDYDFTVHEAAEGISKAGNEQIALTLHVFNRTGQRRTIFDYLPASAKSQWKVRHFAESVGLLRQYETGNLQANAMPEKSGRCKLRVQPASGEYPAKNSVGDYIPLGDRPAASPVQRQAPSARDLDDEIPF